MSAAGSYREGKGRGGRRGERRRRREGDGEGRSMEGVGGGIREGEGGGKVTINMTWLRRGKFQNMCSCTRTYDQP